MPDGRGIGLRFNLDGLKAEAVIHPQAMVDPADHAHPALMAVTVAEARQIAEGQVRAKNG